MPNKELSKSDRSRLQLYLERNGLSVAEASGFFAALATAPDLVMPDEWLQDLISPDNFESLDDAQEGLGLTMCLYNEVTKKMAQNALRIPEELDDRRAWCSGYLRASRREDVWLTDEVEED